MDLDESFDQCNRPLEQFGRQRGLDGFIEQAVILIPVRSDFKQHFDICFVKSLPGNVLEGLREQRIVAIPDLIPATLKLDNKQIFTFKPRQYGSTMIDFQNRIAQGTGQAPEE